MNWKKRRAVCFVIREKKPSLKMAVPAQELRLRGARSTAELALAGTMLTVLDGVLRLDDVWAPTPPSTRGIIHLFTNASTTFCDQFDKKLMADPKLTVL